jgi:MFS family permease
MSVLKVRVRIVFKPYRTILNLPGSLAFTLTGLVARMPMSMIGLGIVLLVSGITGSYGIAGTVTAAYVVAMAVFGPMQARVVDRYGQARSLPVFQVGSTVALGLLVVAIQTGAPTPVPQLLAALAGAASPQIGSYVRSRWTYQLKGKPELHTAYSLEALFDEVVFMVGPPLVTFLATGIHPAAGLGSALVFGLVGGLVFAAQRRTQPPVQPRTNDSRPKPALDWATLMPATAACFGLGVLFGSAEIVVVAVASEAGERALAGWLIAGWATGSMLSALITGTMKLKSSPFMRFRVGLTAMTLTMVPLPFLGNLGVLAVFMFLAGFAISPTLVASVGIVEQTTPTARLSEGIAWTTTGLAGGVALGAAVVGQVIDRFGGHPGFYVPLVAGAVAALVAWLSRKPSPGRPVMHATEDPEPAAAAAAAAPATVAREG